MAKGEAGNTDQGRTIHGPVERTPESPESQLEKELSKGTTGLTIEGVAAFVSKMIKDALLERGYVTKNEVTALLGNYATAETVGQAMETTGKKICAESRDYTNGQLGKAKAYTDDQLKAESEKTEGQIKGLDDKLTGLDGQLGKRIEGLDGKVDKMGKTIPSQTQIIDAASDFFQYWLGKAELQKMEFNPDLVGHAFYDSRGKPVHAKDFDIDEDYNKMIVVLEDSGDPLPRDALTALVSYRVTSIKDPKVKGDITFIGTLERKDDDDNEINQMRIVVKSPDYRGALGEAGLLNADKAPVADDLHFELNGIYAIKGIHEAKDIAGIVEAYKKEKVKPAEPGKDTQGVE